MLSEIDSNEVLQDRYSDIFLSHTVLIVIGTVIGVLGNGATIVVYSSRIKERGERYFIPVLAIVDLIACLTISTNYVMINTYFYDYPSNTICCVTTFLQVFASGLSAHILLIIGVQRYLLVCKPFGPKMTLFWKRVSLAVTCSFTFLYSCPLLGLSGTVTTEDVFLNHTINTTTCRLSTVDAMSVTIYFGLIGLILVCNLVMTTVLCIPVLKRIKISFKKKSAQNLLATKIEQGISIHDVTETSLTKTSGIELESDIITTANKKSSENSETLNIASDQELSNDSNRNDDLPFYAMQQSSTNDNSSTENGNKDNINQSSKSKNSSVKKRISTMFLVIILAYVISYIPPVVFVILRYTIQNFSFITLSKAETFAWFYIGRLLFVNHLANPFIYCYFDVKLKRELKKCCKHE